MAHMIICDVCEATASVKEWKENPGIEASIPAVLLGDLDVEGDEFTFCSWECLGLLVARYTTDDKTEVQQDLDEGEALQTITTADVPDVPETGIFFPEGMKVDGKAPGQLKRRN